MIMCYAPTVETSSEEICFIFKISYVVAVVFKPEFDHCIQESNLCSIFVFNWRYGMFDVKFICNCQ